LEQVIALYVRSKQKKAQEQCAVTENKLLSHGHEISLSRSISDQDNEGDGVEALGSETDRVAIARASRCLEKLVAATYDDDEIDYVGVLNRALPDDIRILGWCPVPQGFSARCISFSSDLSLSFQYCVKVLCIPVGSHFSVL
jgi:hypothetical protein